MKLWISRLWISALILAAMVSRPRVCLRLIPIALFWFAAYWCLHLIAGLWLAPEYSAVWWPNTIELVQFLLPWTWMLFNVLHQPKFAYKGLWVLAAGAALCAAFHVIGIGTIDVDNGIEGRSSNARSRSRALNAPN